MELVNERWAEIKGWEGKYYISDHGRFRSVGGRYKVSLPDGYFTFGAMDQEGYLRVTLRRPKVIFKSRVHSLVAEAFCHKPEGCDVVNHLNGIKIDNRSINLEWTTHGGNIKHAVMTGLFDTKGEKHFNSKLTELQVIEMRMLRKTGLSHQKIADMFGVCRRQAGDVINGVNWGWLKEGL